MSLRLGALDTAGLSVLREALNDRKLTFAC